MFDAYVVNTLSLDEQQCTGCGMCINVCPHDVFKREDRVVVISNMTNCMECGACQKNCPTGAVQVESGVGCAAAMIRAALTGKKEPTCG